MHIVNIMKDIDELLSAQRVRYSLDKVSREREITIIGPSKPGKGGSVMKVTEKLRIRTISHSKKIPLISEILYSFRLMNLIRSLNCDIVNLNSHLQIAALPVVLATTLFHIPLVVTIHGVYSKTNPFMDALQTMYIRTFCRILWRKCDAIVCLTNHDATELASYGCPKHKMAIIPNWVNTDLFKPGTKSDGLKLVWAGRFVPPKGLEYLVRAAKLVVDKYPDCRFVLIGDGPLKSRIVEMISVEKIAGQFDLRGHVTNDVVASELASAAIFVFPSLKEGMPYAVLEAAASGLAIIASDIPSIRAVFANGENALLVKAEDPMLLAEAIMQVLRSEELRIRLQKHARKLVEDRYKVEIVVNKTLDLYEGILQKRKSKMIH